MRKIFVIILFAPLFFILGYFGLRVNAAFQNGHAWADMDWNSDGRVAISEIVEGSDIGQRPVFSEGKTVLNFSATRMVCQSGSIVPSRGTSAT